MKHLFLKLCESNISPLFLALLFLFVNSNAQAEDWKEKYKKAFESEDVKSYKVYLKDERFDLKKMEELIHLLEGLEHGGFALCLVNMLFEGDFFKQNKVSDETDRLLKSLYKSFSESSLYPYQRLLVKYAYNGESFDEEIDLLLKDPVSDPDFLKSLAHRSFSKKAVKLLLDYGVKNSNDAKETEKAFGHMPKFYNGTYLNSFNTRLALPTLLKFQGKFGVGEFSSEYSVLYRIMQNNDKFVYNFSYEKYKDPNFVASSLIEYLSAEKSEDPLNEFFQIMLEDLKNEKYERLKNYYAIYRAYNVRSRFNILTVVEGFEEKKKQFIDAFEQAPSYETKYKLFEAFYTTSFRYYTPPSKASEHIDIYNVLYKEHSLMKHRHTRGRVIKKGDADELVKKFKELRSITELESMKGSIDKFVKEISEWPVEE